MKWQCGHLVVQRVCDFRVVLHTFSRWTARVAPGQAAGLSGLLPSLENPWRVFCLLIPWTLPVLGVTFRRRNVLGTKSVVSFLGERERSACGQEVLCQQEAGPNCPDWERVGVGGVSF